MDDTEKQMIELHIKTNWSEVKLSLCLFKHHAIKMDGEVEVYLHTFLALALAGGGQLHARATLPQENSPWYPLDMRLGMPPSQSGCCGEKSLCPRWETNHDSLIILPFA
jgi:hypothetical protein